MIVVIGAAGTIGRKVCEFLNSWDVEYARRDFRLEGEEHLDVREPRGLPSDAVFVNCTDYRFNLDVMAAAQSTD